jgi:hypothetical protein
LAYKVPLNNEKTLRKSREMEKLGIGISTNGNPRALIQSISELF